MRGQEAEGPPRQKGTDTMNQVTIQGRLATDIDINVETGTATLLVTVQTDGPTRRLDVIPVRADRQHFTDRELDRLTYLAAGAIVTVEGTLQRRVIDGPHRNTRIIVVADSITEPADIREEEWIGR